MKHLLFILLLSCSALPPPRPLPHPQRLDIKADVLFTGAERVLIQRAIAALEYQTAGLLDIRVSYTSNVSDMTLVRVESGYDTVVAVDKMFEGRVYGFTFWLTGRMFLVDDRLDDDDIFIHVVMHEILHAVGLDHNWSESSVMFAFTNARHHATCLDLEDAKQFCKLRGCETERTNYCGR